MTVSHESPISAAFPTMPGVAEMTSEQNVETQVRGPLPLDAQLGQWDRTTTQPTPIAGYFRVKPIIDRLIAALMMVVALPLMMLVGLAVLCFNGWPIFYRQTRTGINGRPFRIWKFRSMRRNAESQTGAVWSCAKDPRVTTLGRWLRCSHLDELPQLINVLNGDMSLIGPRPERPEFVRELAVEMPFYLERLRVLPGITGLAQLNTGYDQTIAQVRQKVLLDIEYIESTSFVQDIKILAGTIPYIVRQVNANRRSSVIPGHAAQLNPQPAATQSSTFPTSARMQQAETHDEISRPHFPNVSAAATGQTPVYIGSHASK